MEVWYPAIFALNANTHLGMGMSPIEALIGRPPTLPCDFDNLAGFDEESQTESEGEEKEGEIIKKTCRIAPID